MEARRQDDGTYSLTGITEDEAEGLAALAAFPLWSAQPERVGSLCADVHDCLMRVGVGDDAYITADNLDMTPHVTVI